MPFRGRTGDPLNFFETFFPLFGTCKRDSKTWRQKTWTRGDIESKCLKKSLKMEPFWSRFACFFASLWNSGNIVIPWGKPQFSGCALVGLVTFSVTFSVCFSGLAFCGTFVAYFAEKCSKVTPNGDPNGLNFRRWICPETTFSYFVAVQGPKASQRRSKAPAGAKKLSKLTPKAMKTGRLRCRFMQPPCLALWG